MTRRRMRHARERGRWLTAPRGPDVPSSNPEHGERLCSLRSLTHWPQSSQGSRVQPGPGGGGRRGGADRSCRWAFGWDGASRQRRDPRSRRGARRSEGDRDIRTAHRPCPGIGYTYEARSADRASVFDPRVDPCVSPRVLGVDPRADVDPRLLRVDPRADVDWRVLRVDLCADVDPRPAGLFSYRCRCRPHCPFPSRALQVASRGWR
jgi:hypothetical protein